MSRMVRIAGGSSLLVAGTAMLVLPGPGLLTIAAGLAVLARDVAWARRASQRIRSLRPRRARAQDGG
ncbi:MAG: PGPGW domain-containing protein [Actinobacteria bacterium]|nr:PGPGW domain-containing protein [Actinomycetota bacterium]